MNSATLTRFESSDSGTFGRLRYNGTVFYTAELPDRDNQSNISCIPVGVYKVIWTFSSRFKRILPELLNVPHRSSIRIHIGNYAGDTSKGYKSDVEGCILLGEGIKSYTNGQQMLTESRIAFERFEKYAGHEDFMLDIK